MRRRRADVVFRRARVAVFVDGCFWHGCPEHGTVPKANRIWWQAKIAANKERDRDTDRALQQARWQSVRVWEHEQPTRAADRIERILRTRSVPRTEQSRQDEK
jgi:DNA mismatch endonuclease (patch repair protein)